jgi:hypothetical protein
VQRRFHIEESQHFLRLLDAELPMPCAMVLVGESALSLGFCPDRAILDFEVWSTTDRVVWTAAERASEKIPRPIHLRQAPLVQSGMSFESRLKPAPLSGVRYLTVLVPEAHDQALLGAARGLALPALADLHRTHPLTLATLVERYEVLTREVSMPRERLRASFLAIVTHLFGEAKALELGAKAR